MNSNNVNLAQLMKILSNMDKKDLENGMNKLNTVLSENDKQNLLNNLKNLNNK